MEMPALILPRTSSNDLMPHSAVKPGSTESFSLVT
jgi:hypothetical protein